MGGGGQEGQQHLTMHTLFLIGKLLWVMRKHKTVSATCPLIVVETGGKKEKQNECVVFFSETEQRVLLGGMEKNIVSLMRGHFCAHVFWVPGGQIFFLPICSPNICFPDTSLHSAQPTYYFIVTHSSICIPDNA